MEEIIMSTVTITGKCDMHYAYAIRSKINERTHNDNIKFVDGTFSAVIHTDNTIDGLIYSIKHCYHCTDINTNWIK